MCEEGSASVESLPSLPGADEEVGEYYFESDPLALKENPDYQQLIKAMVKLQAQRTKAVKDMERLQEAREEALRDPLEFVTALQNGVCLNLPGPQEITQIPHIEWEKYNVKSIMQGMRPNTRKRVLQENLAAQQPVQDSKESFNDDAKILVRGRIYDGSKPQTFNQIWTDEEQRKLEELLIKYPDEAISSHRWVKISKELGTRTPLQVQSRVQKYFIALKRGGLPVPGRNPRASVMRRQGGRKRASLFHGYHPGRISNFMRAFNMYEDEDQGINFNNISSLTEGDAYEDEATTKTEIEEEEEEEEEEEDIAEELHNTEEYQQIMRLKQVRSLKVREMETGIISHPGFTCDVCGMEPIMGPRWHCVECPASTSVDFCEKCVKTNLTINSHQPSHILQSVKALCMRDTIEVLT
ncbi:hypothetical protein OTU49_012306 [Cherax quadricarinatus]|uniref:ZZ-type zinc finger-containing protein 3 n=1 Tax=Cherax quadricarinatus TaxID=27406 RepID=A0AAW0VYW8_CHEQU|nr:ZZ-type zinc finger-containing protein 3-like isoform X2 [Cherax quadricarinatus]